MLQRLNLSGNGIGYDGCLALALGLQRNHSLTSLELARNRVGDDGCDALAAGLEGHCALLNLELVWVGVHLNLPLYSPYRFPGSGSKKTITRAS